MCSPRTAHSLDQTMRTRFMLKCDMSMIFCMQKVRDGVELSSSCELVHKCFANSTIASLHRETARNRGESATVPFYKFGTVARPHVTKGKVTGECGWR